MGYWLVGGICIAIDAIFVLLWILQAPLSETQEDQTGTTTRTSDATLAAAGGGHDTIQNGTCLSRVDGDGGLKEEQNPWASADEDEIVPHQPLPCGHILQNRSKSLKNQ